MRYFIILLVILACCVIYAHNYAEARVVSQPETTGYEHYHIEGFDFDYKLAALLLLVAIIVIAVFFYRS